MGIPVGINTWSRHVTELFPYLDQMIQPFDSLWFPDHVQYNGHKVAEGWTMAVWALARYPDKLVGHDVMCNSFRIRRIWPRWPRQPRPFPAGAW